MEVRWRWQFWVMRPKQAREPLLQAMWSAVLPQLSANRGSAPAFRSFSTNRGCSVITARWRAVWGGGKSNGHLIIILVFFKPLSVWAEEDNYFCLISIFDYYLSLVVVDVEEGVVVRQLDHLEGMFSGFVNDGQVERPVGKGRERGGGGVS